MNVAFREKSRDGNSHGTSRVIFPMIKSLVHRGSSHRTSLGTHGTPWCACYTRGIEHSPCITLLWNARTIRISSSIAVQRGAHVNFKNPVSGEIPRKYMRSLAGNHNMMWKRTASRKTTRVARVAASPRVRLGTFVVLPRVPLGNLLFPVFPRVRAGSLVSYAFKPVPSCSRGISPAFPRVTVEFPLALAGSL